MTHMEGKAKNYLLILFIVLTLVFGSLSLFEVAKSQNATTYTTASTTTITFTTTIASSVPDEDFIVFNKPIGGFYYKRLDSLGELSSVTFRNVTFTSLPLNATYTGCNVGFVKITFQDGYSEVIQTTVCPTGFEAHIYFTNHTKPRAGLMESYGYSPIIEGFYLLVQD